MLYIIRRGYSAANPSASGAALWTPLALGSSTLAIWLKADTIAGTTGDSVSTWSDNSGNARDFTVPVGSNAPTLQAADLNSQNTIRFTRTNTTRLKGSSISGIGSSGSLYYVWKAVSDPGASGDNGPTAFGTDSGNANHTPFTDGKIYNGDLSSARKTMTDPATSLAQYNILGNTSASADFKYYINGVQFFTTGTNTVGFSTTPQVGRGRDGANGSDGWLAEVVLVVDDVTSTTRQLVEGYLAYKWALQSLLDAGHPYKSSPPML